MNFKSILLIGTLALSGLSIANAKSYNFILDQTAKAGTVILAPGEYKVKVDGSNAVFTNLNSQKSFSTPVKVNNASRKNEYTALETTQQNGGELIQAIELGGSTETLEFGE